MMWRDGKQDNISKIELLEPQKGCSGMWNASSPMTIMVPDILHTVCLGMLKHLMDWVTSFLEQHSSIDTFNQLWANMPPYPAFTRINKPCSQVWQWSGEEMKALGRVIVPLFAATLLNPSASHTIPFTEALLRFQHLVYFHLMVLYWYHTEATIEEMVNYLEEFQPHKDGSVNSAPVNLQRRSWKPWKTSLLWSNRRNRTVTQLRTIFLWLLSVVALMKIKHRFSQQLHNILMTNLISTLWRCIFWTTSLTISASLAIF